MKSKRYAVIFLFFLAQHFALGQDTPAPAKKNATAAKNVLYFEGEIVEGELKKPKLFLELGAKIDDPDSILLSRDDFNDFHKVDMKRRFRFIK